VKAAILLCRGRIGKPNSNEKEKQKIMPYPNLGEADFGGLHSKKPLNSFNVFFFFQKKKQKALVLFRSIAGELYSIIFLWPDRRKIFLGQ
jgi:hypothetical protein